MMTLITGQPGHGKTAYAVTRIFDFVKEGREVYVHGIKNFDYERAGAKHIEDPSKWQDLPDGSVVVLDECYSAFPNRNPGAKVPDHVEKLARHRHRGFDFIFMAQQTIQIDPFMKGLFEEHIHVRKKFGRYRKLLRWSAFQSNVKAVCTDAEDWLLPSWVFEYFTSTVLNTSKNRIPKWVWLIALVVLVVVSAGLYLKNYYARKAAAEASATGSTATTALPFVPRGTSGAGGSADAHEPKFATAQEYARAHLPRFATMPWTSEVFDHRAPTSDPLLMCMSSPGGTDAQGEFKGPSCTCLTEQGTAYDIGEPECRRVARLGMPYNPYRTTTPGAAAAVPPPPPAALGGSPGFPPVFGGGEVGTAPRPAVDASFGTMTRARL